MSKDSTSVAPKERISIKFSPATGDQQAEVELPLKVMVVGDFKGKKEDTTLEERETVNINKTNFESVMKANELSISTSVPNKLINDDEAELAINLSFEKMKDFEPDQIVKQVPELNKLVELREALLALKGPLGNIPAFKASLQELIDSDESREKLIKELDLVNSKDKE